jgi:hypothetical protein
VLRHPGCCIFDAKTGCARHSPSKLGSALACTVSVPGLYASHCSCAFSAPYSRLRSFQFRNSVLQSFNISIFVADAATNCAPKVALWISYFRHSAPRRGNYYQPGAAPREYMQVEKLRPVRATALTYKHIRMGKWNVAALTGRRYGGAYSLTRGFAPG